MLEQTAAAGPRRRPGRRPLRRQPAAREHRHRPARRARGAAARRAVAALDPRQRERLWEFISSSPAAARRSLYATHYIHEAERYADRLLVLADGELLFAGSPAELEHSPPRRPASAPPTSRPRSSPSCASRGTADSAMRWLLLKDLQILRRSPLLVALLIVYPIVIAALDRLRAVERPGQAARSRSSTRCRPANDRRPRRREDRRRQGRRARCSTRSTRCRSSRAQEAIKKVRDGDVARRADHPGGHHARSCRPRRRAASRRRRSRSTTTPRTRRSARSSTTRSRRRSQKANAALTKKLTEVAVQYLNLINDGGDFSLLGRDVHGARVEERARRSCSGVEASRCRRSSRRRSTR